MKEIKAHAGLTTLVDDARYHLGFFDIDFSDGNLIFKVFAHPCNKPDCQCDDFRMDFETEGTHLTAWYTSERRWLNHHHKPFPDDMAQIFKIIEKTEMFQERYQHLAFLRRKKVLEDAHRDQPNFQLLVPKELLTEQGPGLGKVSIEHKGTTHLFSWDISFCGDKQCFCQNMFVTLSQGDKHWSFILDPQDEWSATEENFSQPLLSKIGKRFKHIKNFWSLIAVFRSERRLENYHRFIAGYQNRDTTPA